MWDPALYRAFASERARPFFDLVQRVGAEDPGFVVDLGCGTGELTAALASRWPAGRICGIDSSAEMIESAVRMLTTAPDVGAGRLSFALGDVRTWQPDLPPDVIVSNAVLQWVPEHADLLVRWVSLLAAGGWLAFQVPGNFDQPAYQVLRELTGSARWRSQLADVDLNLQGADPAGYLDLLARSDCEVDAWETTYLHVLQGEDPVVRWYRSTGLRPVLAALDQREAAEFLSDYSARLRETYPVAPYGTVFPFRRVFVVAHRS
jgi:trans-aconitate 2-methyltransferase